ncbi:type I restriction enzyme S subunit [Sphingopyxis panaciterrae]|uniref:restriction endonuclease subunit S n=1 Tax=Sphingopyxis panaciterrae TaxID=363841 RepID=UPI00141F72C9|nr:type I restriction enzyme S subunit [Sphingopyxis panaciterrae]
MTPKLRFPEFVGDWKIARLGDFFTFKNGVNADKSMYGSGRKFINVMDVIADTPITHDAIIGSVEISDNEFAKNKVVYGDVLFQRSSETREEVGQSNIYIDQQPATFGGFVIRGHPKQAIDPYYFDALLKTAPVRKDMTSRSGGSIRYNIGQESLDAVSVCVAPDLAEQRKIAAFLSAVDARIDLLRRRRVALERYKKGLMQRIFAQTLRFKRDDGTAFPDWVEKRLGEIAQIVGGGTPDTTEPSYWDGDIPWFTPTEIKSKYLDDSERKLTLAGLNQSSAKLLPIGTLLLSTRANVGDVGIARKECSTNQGFQAMIVKPEHDNEFWYYWAVFHKRKFLRWAAGSTFLEINKTEVSKIVATMPHPDEQRKIAAFLSTVDDRIGAVSAKIRAMQAFKKGLLQQMFV